MRVLIDTNILVSSALFPKSVPSLAFTKAVTLPSHGIVCDYSLDELRRVFNSKFPNKIQDYERFVSIMAVSVEIISTPQSCEYSQNELMIRDIKDRPILRAATAANADIIITGDKDFLESGIKNPRILTAFEFLNK